MWWEKVQNTNVLRREWVLFDAPQLMDVDLSEDQSIGSQEREHLVAKSNNHQQTWLQWNHWRLQIPKRQRNKIPRGGPSDRCPCTMTHAFRGANQAPMNLHTVSPRPTFAHVNAKIWNPHGRTHSWCLTKISRCAFLSWYHGSILQISWSPSLDNHIPAGKPTEIFQRHCFLWDENHADTPFDHFCDDSC